MKCSVILMLSVVCSTSSVAQDRTPAVLSASVSGTAAIVATAASTAAGGPWSALISLVGQFLSAFKNGKVDNKAAQNAVKSAGGLDQGVSYLQAWPNLLADSDDFRRQAIELAQECNFLYYSASDISDDQWSDISTGFTAAEQKFNSIYKNAGYSPILRNALEYNTITTNVTNAWNVVHAQTKHQSKTPAQRKSILQVLLPQMDSITQSAMLPEYWAIEEAKNLASQYQNVSSQAKSVQGKGASDASGGTDQRSNPVSQTRSTVRTPRILSVSLPLSSHAQVVSATRLEDQDSNGRDLAEAARSNNLPPKWMTTSLNQSRREYRTGWIQTLAGAIGGTIVGFILMLFLPSLARARLAPRPAAELGLLQSSLSFRTSESDVLVKQLGALHLDVLNYVWHGGAEANVAGQVPPQGTQPFSGTAAGPIARIQQLRLFLNSPNSGAPSQ